MGDSSDSEEFYDAEEFTPTKGSKRSSMCKNINVLELGVMPEKDKVQKVEPVIYATENKSTSSTEVANLEDDRTTVKSVVQGRRRFQELRRCMQTDEDDDVDEITCAAGSADQQTFTLEHPFKIIAHDTMSLQSMTSLGRIGRILSGASESHPNIRDTAAVPSVSSREPSTISDDNINLADSRNHTVLGGCTMEPDVIASTKANSLKVSRGAGGGLVATCGAPMPHPPQPVAPPRKKKRNVLHGSASVSLDGDNVSVCSEYRPRHLAHALPPLHTDIAQLSAALPSPASTIESLTRELQDSLELDHSKYASDRSSLSLHESRSSERASESSRSSTNQSTRHRTHLEPANDFIAGGGAGGAVGGAGGGGRAAGGGVGGGGRAAGVGAGGAGAGEDERAARTHSEGRSSLAAAPRRSNSDSAGGRRRSAGDEQLGLGVRTRTTSGQQLTDIEILEQVTVLNLDTGERVPLSVAEHKLPQCINPLSLHIMRLTSEYIERAHDDDNPRRGSKRAVSWRALVHASALTISKKRSPTPTSSHSHSHSSNLSIATRETDEESESVCAGGAEDETKETKRESADRQTTGIKRKTEKLKRFFGSTVKKTVDAAKSLAAEVSHARHKEDVGEILDEVRGEHCFKLKASNSHKGPYDFDGCLRHVQEMEAGHSGAVWCCKFSECGRLLATAGQDKLLRVWVTRDAYNMFQDMRTKYNAEQKSSPTPSQESLASLAAPPPAPLAQPPLAPAAPFCPRPFCVYSGHTSDLLDVSWSRNYFILSSSMDKTVRLWHISRGECLCCFQHIDFVTAIVFHPKDDRYFLSGSLDGKLRLWNIPDKKVAVWNEVDGKTKLITAANFCQNGKFAVVGTYDGRCIFYTTDQLKYHTQIDVRSTRGKNSTGRKISGIEPMPCDDKILVTSNDSRIRLYDLRDLNLSCKYKGYVNVSSQIKASFSHDGKYIVSGSENQCIYIWKTYHDYSKFTSVRRDRNDFWEGIKAHNAVVTCAVFAPKPEHMIRTINEREEEARRALSTEDKEDAKGAGPGAEGGMVSSSQAGHVLVSADFGGCIRVFVHRARPKHSSLPASALA